MHVMVLTSRQRVSAIRITANAIAISAGRITSTHPLPVRIRPTFLCLPLRVVGMPVARAILRFMDVTPAARFHENDRPGMPVLERLRLAIEIPLHSFCAIQCHFTTL